MVNSLLIVRTVLICLTEELSDDDRKKRKRGGIPSYIYSNALPSRVNFIQRQARRSFFPFTAILQFQALYSNPPMPSPTILLL